MDLPPEKKCCLHTGFTKKCRALVVKGACERWIHIQGQDAQTGEQINKGTCIDDVGPFLSLENTKVNRQTGAAVESLRNAQVKSFLQLVNMGQPDDPKLINGK